MKKTKVEDNDMDFSVEITEVFEGWNSNSNLECTNSCSCDPYDNSDSCKPYCPTWGGCWGRDQ